MTKLATTPALIQSNELSSILKAEFASIKVELKAELASFKVELMAEFASFKAELKAELASFKAETNAKFDGLNGKIDDLKKDLRLTAVALYVWCNFH
jgi:hypothetical protein